MLEAMAQPHAPQPPSPHPDAAPPCTIAPAGPADASALAALAAVTFPLACPPGVREADVQAYLAQTLSAEAFAAYLADPARTILAARRGGGLVAYAMLVHTPPADPAIAAMLTHTPATEISKFYAHPGTHGTGVSGRLMRAVLALCAARGDAGAWLGVNQQNARARRFYGKHGFTVAGTKTFPMGEDLHDDFVMTRPL